MAEAMTTLSAGLEVQIGDVERELKKLWQTEGDVATRASLMNLAVYCEGEQAMTPNTRLIAQLTQDHACRALLIVAAPSAVRSPVRAWISAHCHLSRAGAKQVCCEQITFLLVGESQDLIPNIVFSHLDSDLPLYLWWQAALPDQPHQQLWAWVDRLIVDSQGWSEPAVQFSRARALIGADDQSRLILRDLNWTRSLYLRQAVAQAFDHPGSFEQLGKIDAVTITHAPGARTTAILVLAWLQTRLEWGKASRRSEGIAFSPGNNGQVIQVNLAEEPGKVISRFQIRAGEATFTFVQDPVSDLWQSEVRLPNCCEYRYLLPAGKDDALSLINEELMRGGKHQVFLRALAAAEALL